MRLLVRVLEAKNLPATDQNGLSDPYVRLKLGKQKVKTKVVKKNSNPSWGEEFSFRVKDMKKKLVVNVLDEDKYFNDDFVGCLKVPVSRVFDAENKSLGTTWYSLRPKNKWSKLKDCGEILLSIWFSQNHSFADLSCASELSSMSKKSFESMTLSPAQSFCALPAVAPLPSRSEEVVLSKDEKCGSQKTFAVRIAQMFNKNPDTISISPSSSVENLGAAEVSTTDGCDGASEDLPSSESFEEMMKTMEARDAAGETPSNLPGGVLLDQLYLITPSDLNSLLFSPDSSFPRSLADSQGNTEQQFGAWKFENGGEILKRVVTFIKAPTKLIKAVKATEEQTYLKADGNIYSVLATVSTPDVMYGSTFRVELLFTVMPGPELPSGEQASRLIISWRLNFLQSTMMKGMIENGARQGLKDNFEQFASLLSQTIKPVDLKDLGSSKEQVLASLQSEPQSTWKLAVRHFANLTVVSTVFAVIYVCFHIWMVPPSSIQGLEFVGFDLPDSISELVVCGVLVLQCERVLKILSRFMQARVHKGGDHGVKAQGDGWLLTVALIEGYNLAAVDSSGLCDPYVVFTCNGKTRTSSIKFQESSPLWNEIFEFDAMDDPPSVLDVEVYDFDGPFDEATSLGHAQINFLKCNVSDLADLWVPLNGKLSQACQSKLLLRIFLDNTKGNNVVKEYINKMEKEVGKKINVRSPQTNSAFQKLFELPPEEFLINDFTCHLKRKMPLQGRLFLSPRIIGFNANLFGRKTRFFFLWEDIEDIQIQAPTLSSMGSPVVVITLWKGKGMDAKHGAKTIDEQGRLKFYFQSFVYLNVAQRIIMALWKARALTPEQKLQLFEEDSETKMIQNEESGSFLGLEDVSLSEVYSASLPIPINVVLELFGGGDLDHKVMEKTGCLNYSCTPWESEKADVYERQVYYRFQKNVSRYRGEVTSTQQKYPLPDGKGWFVEEVMSFHGVPLADYYNLQIRYQIEHSSPKQKGCQVCVFLGIECLKITRNQKRIAKNIVSNMQDRFKMMFAVVEREFSGR